MSACRACGLDHAAHGLGPGDPCSRVKRLAATAEPVANAEAGVANKERVVANAPKRADRHAKTDARRLYMRDLMRRKRAAKVKP